jgi:hypothetical protein
MRMLRDFLPGPLTLVFFSTCGANAYAQAELRQKLVLVKESVAENQAALRQYTWTEQTNILLKDELKRTRFDQCRYGPDGTVQKTRVGDSPSPQEKRGLRGRLIEKKTDGLEGYIQQAVALVKDYVPPNPQQMDADFQAGNMSSGQAEPGALHLNFRNYRKPGDSLVLTFDRAAKALTQITVNTYIDKKSDAVTLQVDFQKLPNGLNYVVQVVLKARAKNIQIQTTTSNYRKMQAFLQRVQTRF